jgi:hypothetical protein
MQILPWANGACVSIVPGRKVLGNYVNHNLKIKPSSVNQISPQSLCAFHGPTWANNDSGEFCLETIGLNWINEFRQ